MSKKPKFFGGVLSFALLQPKERQSLKNSSITETVFHAGIVNAGEVVSHDFRLENDSDISVEIKDVISSCSCTTANISRGAVIPSGDSTRFSISFHTEGLAGEQSNFILLKTNHPQTPERLFVLSCTIKDVFSYTPKHIDFGDVFDVYHSNKKTITLWDSQFEGFLLTGIEADSPFLIYDSEKIIGTESDGNRSGVPGFCVSVKLSPEVPQGKFSSTLKLKTNLDTIPIIEIPVKALVLSPVYSQPDRLAFGVLTEHAPASLDFMLCVRNNVPLGDVRVKCDVDYIKCESISSVENKYRVTINIDRAPKQQAISSQISVQTTAGAVIVIPLSFYLDF